MFDYASQLFFWTIKTDNSMTDFMTEPRVVQYDQTTLSCRMKISIHELKGKDDTNLDNK